MTRITTTILILLVLANGSATIMSTSGLSEDLGVELNPGIDEEMDKVVDEMKKGFSPSTTIVESLLSMLVAFGRLFLVLIEGMFAAPTMLINLGFPDYIVTVFFAPAYIVSTLELGSMMIGRRTV